MSISDQIEDYQNEYIQPRVDDNEDIKDNRVLVNDKDNIGQNNHSIDPDELLKKDYLDEKTENDPDNQRLISEVEDFNVYRNNEYQVKDIVEGTNNFIDPDGINKDYDFDEKAQNDPGMDMLDSQADVLGLYPDNEGQVENPNYKLDDPVDQYDEFKQATDLPVENNFEDYKKQSSDHFDPEAGQDLIEDSKKIDQEELEDIKKHIEKNDKTQKKSEKNTILNKKEKIQPDKNSINKAYNLETLKKDSEKIFHNQIPDNPEKNSESPETPNLGSPVKEIKIAVRSEGSAYWSKSEPESESERLKRKVEEYETIIERQSQEINDLKKQLNSYSREYSRQYEKPNIKSPKSSGFLQKKIEGSYLKKEPENFRKEDLDFWKISENEPDTIKEPQKLEDIASLKGLWIYNMESAPPSYNKFSGKKLPGVKPNPLMRYDSHQKTSSKAKLLPKIQTKKDLKDVQKPKYS
jgi:hypothetical protein